MALVGFTDDLERFQYGGRMKLPEQSSYQLTTQDGTVVSNSVGGLPKSQVQYFSQPYGVDVNYRAMDGFEASYIHDFLNRHNGQKFIAELLIGGTETEEFVVMYTGNTKGSLTGFNGNFPVSLIVEPAIDRCWQQFIADFAPCMGSDTAPIFCYANLGIKALP
ncbi:conserved hypothetical protein [Vibrio phage 242E40-1]|nr:conserved hypothetical protein [Vibrio phage 242E40-1]